MRTNLLERRHMFRLRRDFYLADAVLDQREPGVRNFDSRLQRLHKLLAYNYAVVLKLPHAVQDTRRNELHQRL